MRKLCEGGGGVKNSKLSRVMRRGHFSKVSFKGESTVSYRFKPQIPRSPPPRPAPPPPAKVISNDWSHRPSEPCDNVPSPIVLELVRARSAFTVANQGNAPKNSPDSYPRDGHLEEFLINQFNMYLCLHVPLAHELS